ncbi:head-tail connector protein [Xanthobacter aminoxidans]|uniref:head-tail connector protein n=1 Tax=Xanthobacter aminoxidans TaxID=186280 RepID=UPI003729EC58
MSVTNTLSITSLSEVKAHLNISTDTDDELLTSIIEVSRNYVESWCGPLDDFEGTVPPAIVQAMKMHVGHLYENREASTFSGAAAELPLGFFDLIGPYRKWAFG